MTSAIVGAAACLTIASGSFLIAIRSSRTHAVLMRLVLSLAMLGFAFAARAQSVRLVAAGSLNRALTQVAQAFTATTEIKVTQTYAPPGTVRQQIEAGLRPDVFASADTTSPQALEREGLAGPVKVFATNQIVAVIRSGIGKTVGASDVLDVLLDGATRIGTSTPVADPLGDYMQRIFQKADAIVRGAAATLEAKRVELVANPNAPAVPAGANSLVYFLDTTQTVGVFIFYVTSVVQRRGIDPTLQIVLLPQDLTVSTPYGVSVLQGASAGGRQFAEFM